MTKFHYLATTALLLGCGTPERIPAGTTIVPISDGINFLVTDRGDGLWEATPKQPDVFMHWGFLTAINNNVVAIEKHTGCKVDHNALISVDMTTRAPVVC